MMMNKKKKNKQHSKTRNQETKLSEDKLRERRTFGKTPTPRPLPKTTLV